MPSQLSASKKLLFIAATAIILVVALEAFLQVFYFATVGDFLFRRAIPPIYETDPVRCYRVKPNLSYVHRTNEFDVEIFTNSIGLRTDASHREIQKKKPDDVYRILITGPSFAFGWGSNYEDIYSTLIESGLTIPGKRIEIINLGTPSQGPAHQLCWIKKTGFEYSPDMVFHTSYGPVVKTRLSDCPEDLSCPDVRDGQLVPHDLSTRDRLKGYFKRFGTVFYGYYAYNMIVRPDPGPDPSKALHGPTAAGSDADVETVVQSYIDYETYVKSILGSDTIVAFMYLPYSYQVHPEDIGRFSDVYVEDVNRNQDQITKALQGLKSRDVAILDTLPPLLDHAADERLYFWLDIHLTPAGNHVVAEAAIPFLSDLILNNEYNVAPTDDLR